MCKNNNKLYIFALQIGIKIKTIDNMKRFTFALLAMLIIGACTPGMNPPNKESEADNADKNFTEEIDTSDKEYGGDTAEDSKDDVVGDDDDTYWEASEFDKKVNVVFAGAEATVECTTEGIVCHKSGADVTIDTGNIEDVEITIQGTTTDGQLKLYGKQNIKLILNNISLTSAKSAAINCQNSSTLFVHMTDGSNNILTDAKKQSDEAYYPDGVTASDEKRNGALYAKGDVVISGNGSLEVNGNKKHGISVKKSLMMRPGVTLVIPAVTDNCIKADGVTIAGGYLWAKATSDATKCISSDSYVTISGGKLELYTTGNAIYDEEDNDTSSAAGIKADGDVNISAGEIRCVSTGTGGKGLNVDGKLTIDGGAIDVATSGGKFIYNSAQDLDSSPKGVKAEGEIVMNGGVLNIQVTGRSDGSEGLESKSKITINDGELFVYAYDDAINVGGDNPVGIEINGGKIFAFADNNDGIDSNAKMWINGGIVIASGSAAPEEGLDCDRSQNFIVTGGILVGTGGAAVSSSTSSTQRSVIYNGIAATTGELVAILDAENNPILIYEMPRTMSKCALFFSSAEIISQKEYKVYSGGSIEGNTENWNGLYLNGNYKTGTLLGSFTSTATTTTVGSSGGPGGGPGNGGPGGGGFGPGFWG